MDLKKVNKLKEMTARQRKAAQLFAKIKEWGFYPSPETSPFTGTFYTKEGMVPVVVKVRNHTLEQFETSIFEKKFIDKICKQAKKVNVNPPLYVEFFEDDAFLYYDLGELPFEWIREEMNENTLDSTTKKTYKWVAQVPRHMGKEIRWSKPPELPLQPKMKSQDDPFKPEPKPEPKAQSLF